MASSRWFGRCSHQARPRSRGPLLTQYKNLTEPPLTNPPTVPRNFGNLCTTLAKSTPANFPPPAPEKTCESETPEETINRFIEYYNREVKAISSAVNDGVERMTGADKDPSIEKTLFQYGPIDTEETLFTSTFLVGPIPVNLEVLSLLHYGVDVGVRAALKPWAVLQIALQPNASPDPTAIGELALTGTPYIGVGAALFVGVGFDVGVAAAKVGIEGALNLGDVSLPVHAGVQLKVGQQDDPRPDPPTDLQSLVTSIKKVPTRTYSLQFGYMFGADLHLGNILTGKLSAKVKIKFFWFSKTWRATIFQFAALACPGKGPQGEFVPKPGAITTDDKPCHFRLFSGDGSFPKLSDKTPAWASISMPIPFYELSLIKGSQAPGTEVFSQAKSKELFYDNLCECIKDRASEEADDIKDEQGRPVGPPDRLCTRNDDCCSNVPVCYSNPENSGKKECTTCRRTTQNCNVNEDCCGFGPSNPNVLGCFDEPYDAAGSPKHCSNKRLLGETCNVASDCAGTPGLGCWLEPFTNRKICAEKRPENYSCRTSSDCVDWDGVHNACYKSSNLSLYATCHEWVEGPI